MELQKLISEALKDNRSAQKLLYRTYKDRLYTLAYRICGDFELANDILQETFIEGFKKLHKLNEANAFYGWIRTILVRKAYAQVKSRTESEDIEQLQAPVNHYSAFDVEYIEKAIQLLPDKSRAVFVMAEVEGFSHSEISEAMNISVGTSKSQLNFAKTKLKKWLRPYIS